MRTTETFAPPAAVLHTLEALRAAGYEAWAVGGCVRDSLLGCPPHDWDVTTSALPQQTMQVFAGQHLLQTGLHHGTVTLLAGGEPIEITTYRVDGPYSDSRRPDSVTFTASLEQDLARRDFTINAMAWNPWQGLRDPFGGQADLADGLLRCVGSPAARFEEDALRIIRGLRFAARLGFGLHPQTAAATHAQAQNLRRVAVERIWPELVGLCCGRSAAPVLLEYGDVIGTMLPPLAPMLGFDQRNYHHIFSVWEHSVRALGHVPPQPALRLAALLHDCGKPASFTLDETGTGHFYGHAEKSLDIAAPLLKKLTCPGDLRRQICTLVEHHDTPLPLERPRLRRWVARLGPQGLLDLITLKRADNAAQSPAFDHTEYYDQLEALARQIIAEGDCCTLAQLAVDGRDLLALGLQGSQIGTMLAALLADVMDDRLPNDRQRLLHSVQRRLQKKSDAPLP